MDKKTSLLIESLEGLKDIVTFELKEEREEMSVFVKEYGWIKIHLRFGYYVHIQNREYPLYEIYDVIELIFALHFKKEVNEEIEYNRADSIFFIGNEPVDISFLGGSEPNGWNNFEFEEEELEEEELEEEELEEEIWEERE